jgi:hypothetical protein
MPFSIAVDDLISELGSIRNVATGLRVSADVRTAVDQAIAEAADAVNLTIDGPTNPNRLLAARDALGVVEEMILALDAQFARGLRARVRSEALRARAVKLIERARMFPPGPSK